MGFRLSKNFVSAFVLLIFVASSAFGGKYVILKPDGTYHDAVKVNGVWQRADGSEDEVPAVSPQFTQGYIDVLRYWHGTNYYYPWRGAGSINMTWFTSPAACSLISVRFFLYSPGEALIYVWDSPFPYVTGMSSAQLEDSMYKYWVYDTTIAHSITGWTSMPAAIVDGIPLTSACSTDGSAAWTDLDLTPLGGPFDIPEGKSFWLAHMITDTTFGGRPWIIGESGCCIDVPGRSWQYRTTRFDPPEDFYNFYCYSDAVGDWCYEAIVYVYGIIWPTMSVDRLPDTYFKGPYPITARIVGKPHHCITRVKVYWNINGGPYPAPFDSADLTAVDSIEYTGIIAATASPGDTIWYYVEADDEQPRTGFIPPPPYESPDKDAPWNFIVREKANTTLFVYGDQNCDPVILNILDTLGLDYDMWDADGYLTGRSYGSPDSSVINAGYHTIVWVTWSGLHFANAGDWVMQYFDSGGNLFLSGTDAFANYVQTYDHIVLDPAIHPLLTDYFHFTEITDDCHLGEDIPAWLYGAEGDIISGPFYEEPILFNPAYTYSGQSDWMGTATHDGSVTDIFFDESDVATGYRYEDAAKGYQYVFLYWNVTALSNPGYDDTLGVFDFDAAMETIFRSLVWFCSVWGIEEPQDAGKMTQEPRLFQNHPNPFRLATEFRYALTKDDHVRFEIYNISGQKVITLVAENQKAGHQKIHWDGRDNGGKEVAPGIYFYKLKVGDYTETKKMILVK